MRGSQEYQCSLLAGVVFESGLSKLEQKKEGMLANTSTINAYKEVWIDLIRFIESNYGVKDFQSLHAEHIAHYVQLKFLTGISIQRAQLVVSAIGKLETALKKLATHFGNAHKYTAYDFSIRHALLKEAKQCSLLKQGSKAKHYSRAYADPLRLIESLSDPLFKLAAKIQLEGGARVAAVETIYRLKRIKPEKLCINHLNDIAIVEHSDSHVFVSQLQGIKEETYTKKSVGYLLTVEKGGKPGLIILSIKTYQELEHYLNTHECFKINYDSYITALKKAAENSQQVYQGSHGLRWNYAQNRTAELLEHGYSLTLTNQIVSWEMKHERDSTTQHYNQ